MNKKIIIIITVIAVIGLAIAGYFYWQKSSPGNQVLKQASDAVKKLTDSITQGTLPSIDTNPLKNKPDINPADKANPYKNTKTNPFE